MVAVHLPEPDVSESSIVPLIIMITERQYMSISNCCYWKDGYKFNSSGMGQCRHLLRNLKVEERRQPFSRLVRLNLPTPTPLDSILWVLWNNLVYGSEWYAYFVTPKQHKGNCFDSQCIMHNLIVALCVINYIQCCTMVIKSTKLLDTCVLRLHMRVQCTSAISWWNLYASIPLEEIEIRVLFVFC